MYLSSAKGLKIKLAFKLSQLEINKTYVFARYVLIKFFFSISKSFNIEYLLIRGQILYLCLP